MTRIQPRPSHDPVHEFHLIRKKRGRIHLRFLGAAVAQQKGDRKPRVPRRDQRTNRIPFFPSETQSVEPVLPGNEIAFARAGAWHRKDFPLYLHPSHGGFDTTPVSPCQSALRDRARKRGRADEIGLNAIRFRASCTENPFAKRAVALRTSAVERPCLSRRAHLWENSSTHLRPSAATRVILVSLLDTGPDTATFSSPT